jgi:hypothetical protein
MNNFTPITPESNAFYQLHKEIFDTRCKLKTKESNAYWRSLQGKWFRRDDPYDSTSPTYELLVRCCGDSIKKDDNFRVYAFDCISLSSTCLESKQRAISYLQNNQWDYKEVEFEEVKQFANKTLFSSVNLFKGEYNEEAYLNFLGHDPKQIKIIR